MDLILQVRTGRDRVTLACYGKLIEGKETEAFRRSALLLLGGFDKMTINLAGVRGADFGGLWSVAAVLALAEERGKQVRITHPSPAVLAALESCGLGRFLHTYGATLGSATLNSPQEAIA
jgi:anti-anti-sigma regulatory factor